MLLREHLFLRHLASTNQPILLGPWRSETGFEVLYWLPWLQRFRQQHQISKDRLIAISRGGAAHWYDAGHQIELYDYAPVERVRKTMLRDSKQHASIKQNRRTGWETKLLALIAHDLGLRRYHVLHPSWMYQGLSGFWNGTQSAEVALRNLPYDPFPVPHPPLTLPLPERYVAVRFYGRHTWPLTEEVKVWAANLVDNLAKKIPVVVLNSPFHADEHQDLIFEGTNILSIAPHVTLQNNLAIQSGVIAKATAFVGTYGGTMQLAVRLRRPSVGFYTKFEGTAYAHKELTHRLGTIQGTPVFIGRPDDARFVHEIIG